MTPLATAEFAGGVCLAACIPAYWLAGMAKEARRERAERKERVRARRAHLAAIEAAEDDDPAFAPDAVRRSIVQMVALADRVWRGRTSTALNGRPDGELINGWARARLAWHQSMSEPAQPHQAARACCARNASSRTERPQK